MYTKDLTTQYNKGMESRLYTNGRLYTNDLMTHHYKEMGGHMYTNDLTTQQYKGMEGRL